MIVIKRRLTYIFRGTLLRLRITWNKTDMLTLSVGYHIDRTDAKGKPKWDGTRCRLNTTHGEDQTPASVINKALEILENKVEAAFLKFEKLEEMPDKEQLKKMISGEPSDRKRAFFDVFDEFIKEGTEVSQWSVSTQRKMKTMKKLLYKFRPNLTFKDINADMMKNLMAYQTKNAVVEKSEKEEKSGKQIIKYKGRYQNDTINRNMKNFRWFLKWAVEKGYHSDLSFMNNRIKYKTPKRPVIYLTWDELMKVMDLDLGKRPELERTRDMFAFCCFTSLRYSDLVNLSWGDVGEDAITVTTIKTVDAITIDLNDHSRRIIEKYRKAETVDPKEKVFPVKSSQKMNLRLKEIGKLSGIDTPVHLVEIYGSERRDITVPKYELLSTHCGRRTFISNAISMGIAPSVVMKWTGHSDYKAMQPYIDIVDEVRKSSMKRFNQFPI